MPRCARRKSRFRRLRRPFPGLQIPRAGNRPGLSAPFPWTDSGPPIRQRCSECVLRARSRPRLRRCASTWVCLPDSTSECPRPSLRGVFRSRSARTRRLPQGNPSCKLRTDCATPAAPPRRGRELRESDRLPSGGRKNLSMVGQPSAFFVACSSSSPSGFPCAPKVSCFFGLP